MVQERRILYEHLDVPDINTFDVFRQYDGYKRFEKAIAEYQPEEIATIVLDSGLKGRGGAGFSTGEKWSFVPRDIEPRYLCCNADESEPGTFSNRYVLEKNPHLLIEGILICCYAMGIETTYVYIRGEFTLGKKMLDAAIKEAYEHGYLGKDVRGTGLNIDIYTHPGAGAYICGEETGLIESLEGKNEDNPATSRLFLLSKVSSENPPSCRTSRPYATYLSLSAMALNGTLRWDQPTPIHGLTHRNLMPIQAQSFTASAAMSTNPGFMNLISV